jgi:hypothetical protein
MEEGPFSENGNPKFFSSGGEEWAILGEVFTACLLFLTWRSPFSEKATKGCHTFLHGEAILLAPLIPHSPFSENPFSDLREGVTTPILHILLSPFSEKATKVSHFLHGEAILLTPLFLILHSPRTHSPTSEKV